jgi:uncharacterized protein YvpB
MRRRKIKPHFSVIFIGILIPVLIAFVLSFNVKIQVTCKHDKKQQSTESITETQDTKKENPYIDDSRKFEYEIYIPMIAQNPELPTGCEVTALTMILRYNGFDIDKLTLADKFLPKGEIGETHPDVAFIGNPRDKHSYGANAPVLVKTANDYLSLVESNLSAHLVQTNDVEDLMKYLHEGYPVMIWVTMDMEEGYYSTKWDIDGQEVQWYAKEHSMVLTGYTNTHYILADPLSHESCYYEKILVEKRYDELGNQALVIY